MKNDSRIKTDKISVLKRVFSIVVILACIMGIVSVHASNNNIAFAELTVTGNVSYRDGIKISNAYPACYMMTYESGLYAFNYVKEGVLYNICFCSLVKHNNSVAQISNGNLYGSYDTSTSYNNGEFYYDYTSSTGNLPSMYADMGVLPTFSTLNEGLQAFSEFINPAPPPEPGYPLNYTLPAGNIAYLEIDTSLFNGVNLATIMPELSGVGSSDPWSLSSQFYAMTDNILSNGDSVYDLNGTRIVWSKSSNASTNLLGQTDHAVWESRGPYPNKTYFVICNPFYFFDNENNSSITIVANGIKNVYVQPLKTVVQQNGNEISYNTTVDGGTYEGEVTDDLGPIEWTDPDGGNTAPGTSTSNTPVTGVNQFQQWLQGILQQIISVFEPAHDAITTLASAVQNFSGWLKALYIWLPSPVLNLLTSAISLAIIIGVIKVFI